MAKQTIQIADKPTLDEIKALLENNGYGLETLKKLIESGESYPNVSFVSAGGSSSNDARIISITGKGIFIPYSLYYSSQSESSSNFTKLEELCIDGVAADKYISSFSPRAEIKFNESLYIKTHYYSSSYTSYGVIAGIVMLKD